MENVATKATNWLDRWLDMFKDAEDKPMTATECKDRTRNWFIENAPLSDKHDTFYDVWLEANEKMSMANSILSDAPFVSSIDNGSCDCSYCRGIREAKIKEVANAKAKENERLAKEAIERRAIALNNAIETILKADDFIREPTAFQGFDLMFDPAVIHEDETAVTVWLRDCEKIIADHLGMSEAWVHVSINGDSLC